MYARAVTIQLHPDKIAEAGQIMEEVAEQLQGVDGFHEISLLADEATGHGHIISLWESEAAIRTTAPTIFQGAVERLAPLFAAPPRAEVLKVVMHSDLGSDLLDGRGGADTTAPRVGLWRANALRSIALCCVIRR